MFDDALDALIDDKRRVGRLLKLEKRRRGVGPNDLVFVGLHNIAQFWWCGMYAVRKSRANEIEFFAAYLRDRIWHSFTLGRLSTLPTSEAELLDIGSNLTLENIQHLCLKDSGEPRMLLKNLLAPLLQGNDRSAFALELTRGESYPTFRWHFQWGRYVLVGVPDGITKRFVYEFKTARDRGLFAKVARPVAMTQADLYGHFFGRKSKRVQVLIKDEDQVETLKGPIDQERVTTTLNRFASVDGGKLPVPPQAWKCRSCEVAEGCPQRQK